MPAHVRHAPQRRDQKPPPRGLSGHGLSAIGNGRAGAASDRGAAGAGGHGGAGAVGAQVSIELISIFPETNICFQHLRLGLRIRGAPAGPPDQQNFQEELMSNHPTLKPFNFQKWVAEHADLLRPPVGNQLLHKEGDMIVMVVGGPNTRVDFHDDPVEEWFFQLKGDMMLKIADGEKSMTCRSARARCFLCPPMSATRRSAAIRSRPRAALSGHGLSAIGNGRAGAASDRGAAGAGGHGGAGAVGAQVSIELISIFPETNICFQHLRLGLRIRGAPAGPPDQQNFQGRNSCQTIRH